MTLSKQSHPGSKNPRALLNETQIVIIRRLYSERSYKQVSLATTFKVSQSAISRIVRKQRWK